MLVLRGSKKDQMDVWKATFPDLFELDEELERVDRILRDSRFLEPFVKKMQKARVKIHTGRPGLPIDQYMRLMYLKHAYQVSYETLIREVSDSLKWRTFCGFSLSDKLPDPTTLMKLTKRFGPEIVKQLNDAVMVKAAEEKVLRSRTIRVDTTVTEANIHHPTDAGLLVDGIKKITQVVKKLVNFGYVKKAIRDRTKSAKRKLMEISQVARARKKGFIEKINKITEEVVQITRETMKGARLSLDEGRRSLQGLGNAKRQVERVVEVLNETMCLTERLIEQAYQVIQGNRNIKDRIVSLHDAGARPIVKGKAGKRTEFGRKVVLVETKEGFISHYEVHEGNPSDHDLVVDAVKGHIESTGSVPTTMTADRGMSGAKTEEKIKDAGVKNVVIPRKGRKSKERKQEEKKPSFRRTMRWRAGIEGRISHLKRCYGLRRSLRDGLDGTQSWVGLGLMAYNVTRLVKLKMET